MLVPTEQVAQSYKRCVMILTFCYVIINTVALAKAQFLGGGESNLGRTDGSKTPQEVLSKRFGASMEQLSSHASHRDGASSLKYSLTNEFQNLKSRPSISSNDGPDNGAVCANGLKIAFDCALRRVSAMGVRDILVQKYEVPLVALDVCQSSSVVDIENCIPDRFIDMFPTDMLVQVVRDKRLLVGTIDLTAFPQLTSDQANTSGFYPDLLQAIVRELTIIVLQNPGLRKELLGATVIKGDILSKSFAQRLGEFKEQQARCHTFGHKSNRASLLSISTYRESFDSGNDVRSSPAKASGKAEYRTHQGSRSHVQSDCSSWSEFGTNVDELPKEMMISISYVHFRSSLNLIAAVHRGEVHMMDIGTLASAYLPQRYNFLSLRDILEPSCTIGAWKSFFLMRDPSVPRRVDRRNASYMNSSKGHTAASGAYESNPFLDSAAIVSGATAAADDDLSHIVEPLIGDHSASHDLRQGIADANCPFKGRCGVGPAGGDVVESWEEKMMQTRRLFWRLFGIQADPDAELSHIPLDQGSGRTRFEAEYQARDWRSNRPEPAFEHRMLVKFHHVDHFAFSYLFPENYRISSVRKLTDYTSLVNDGESVGAFGYGLAGRLERRRCSSPLRSYRLRSSGPLRLPPGFDFGNLVSLSSSNWLDGCIKGRVKVFTSRRPSEEGLQQVEFPGPLAPLAAFFAKSRDPVCRGIRSKTKEVLITRANPLPSSGIASLPLGCAALLIVATVMMIV